MRTVSSKTELAGLVGRDWDCAGPETCAVLAGSMRDDVEAEAEGLVEEDWGDMTDIDDEVDALEALLRREVLVLPTVSVFGDGLRLVPEYGPETATTEVSIWSRVEEYIVKRDR